MWMMGYNDGGGELNFQDHSSFNGRKLRPLIPRPLSSLSSSSPPPPNPHDFFSHFHHMATVTDQSKREFHTPPVVVSSRWNPTPEQLRVLEELYRRGTRTPSAEQIQHITAQLRRYGKIEGKNVFYWFQNHKARERQKRRRQMESSISVDNSSRDVEIIERKDSESGRKAYQVVEQTKNWAPSTNCSTLPEESVPIQRVEKANVMTECRTTDGWIQFDDEMGELHQRRNNNFGEKNAAASSLHHHQQQQHMMMQLPDCPGCCCSTTTTATTITTIPKPHHNNNINNNNLTSFIRSYRETILEEGEEEGEFETLQLFPLCSDIIRSNNEMGGKHEESEISGNSTTMNTHMTPLQFFEFLPLKN